VLLKFRGICGTHIPLVLLLNGLLASKLKAGHIDGAVLAAFSACGPAVSVGGIMLAKGGFTTNDTDNRGDASDYIAHHGLVQVGNRGFVKCQLPV
jgi:hypothetical protein